MKTTNAAKAAIAAKIAPAAMIAIATKATNATKIAPVIKTNKKAEHKLRFFWLELNDGANLEVDTLKAVVHPVAVTKACVPRVVIIVLGRRPSVGVGCELFPTCSNKTCVYRFWIVFIWIKYSGRR